MARLLRLDSLQTRLILAFLAVAFVALTVAGAAFVVIRRGDQEQQALDRVAYSSTSIQAQFFTLQLRGSNIRELESFLEDAADQYDVRTLLVNRADASVVHDSGGELAGQVVTLDEAPVIAGVAGAPNAIRVSPIEFRGSRPFLMADNLVTVSGGEFGTFQGAGYELPAYRAVIAVPEDTLQRAWTDLLPGLGVAAGVAVPAAVLLAIVVARYITRPLGQLTAASLQLAEGRFDVEVPSGRRDEVGRLSTAFQAMAGRVGKTNTEMRTLVANVSHDMKTPLTSILGFSQALRDGAAASPADAAHMGDVIHEEATRLSARLEDLLYLSELESGSAVVQLEPADAGVLLAGVAARLRPTYDSAGIALEVEAPPGFAIRADLPKLERALENLLENARKFTPAGALVRAVVTATPGHVRISIANPNPGLTADELPRLFERFYRHERSRAPGGPAGSGLGLAIARDLVALHGGTLEAALHGDQVVFELVLPGLPTDSG